MSIILIEYSTIFLFNVYVLTTPSDDLYEDGTARQDLTQGGEVGA